jgi:catechol 2,3-dioxygenase-like lactoylglutathione lyase family enzyme
VPLNHVALTVSDREVSAAFYGQHFRLTERVHDDEHRLILGLSDGSLVALTEGLVPEGFAPHQPLRLPGRGNRPGSKRARAAAQGGGEGD